MYRFPPLCRYGTAQVRLNPTNFSSANETNATSSYYLEMYSKVWTCSVKGCFATSRHLSVLSLTHPLPTHNFPLHPSPLQDPPDLQQLQLTTVNFNVSVKGSRCGVGWRFGWFEDGEGKRGCQAVMLPRGRAGMGQSSNEGGEIRLFG